MPDTGAVGASSAVGIGGAVGTVVAVTGDKAGDEIRFCDCITYQTLKLASPFMKGSEVMLLQDLLRRAGFYRGRRDGIFGPSTHEAVKAFQEAMGLPKDGIAGHLTWSWLFEEWSGAPGARVPVALSQKERGTPRVIVIDVETRTLTLYEGTKALLEIPCAVGKPATPSPVGEWRIISKKSWGGGFGTRWMGLSVPWGQYGIHGTNKPWSIGQAASGGCIRLYNSEVEKLFELVEVGTRVKITGGPHGVLRNPRRFLGLGERGADVLEVQRRLVELGIAKLTPDGVYRETTREAVKKFQKSRGIQSTGEVDEATYDALGLFAFE